MGKKKNRDIGEKGEKNLGEKINPVGVIIQNC